MMYVSAAKTISQMRLCHFCEEYDIPRTTVLQWIHSKGFPAYRLSGRWYIDIKAFLEWREKEHKCSYKYS